MERTNNGEDVEAETWKEVIMMMKNFLFDMQKEDGKQNTKVKKFITRPSNMRRRRRKQKTILSKKKNLWKKSKKL